MDATMLEKLNAFTRRKHTAEEVYLFDLLLCDNEIDRDGECFSEEALQKLKALFVGVTGIFDHNPKGSNQTARIFDTALVTDPARKTRTGAPYTCLKAHAYMIRTDANADLIREIDGGIKKEVSISCAASAQRCSICGADRHRNPCAHTKGRQYGGKLCYVLLDGITDAYEWSFVAVPAQRDAGVTKQFGRSHGDTAVKALQTALEESEANVELLREDICRDVTRLLALSASKTYGDLLVTAAERLPLPELLTLKQKLLQSQRGTVTRQLAPPKADETLDSFRL